MNEVVDTQRRTSVGGDAQGQPQHHLDVASGDVEEVIDQTVEQLGVKLDVVAASHDLPNLAGVLGTGRVVFDDGRAACEDRLVDAVGAVRGEEEQPVEVFEGAQELRDDRILGQVESAFEDEDIGLVEEEHGVPALGAVEDDLEVLPHGLGGDAQGTGVDRVQRFADDLGIHLGGQGLADSGTALGEDDVAGGLAVDDVAGEDADVGGEDGEQFALLVGEDELVLQARIVGVGGEVAGVDVEVVLGAEVEDAHCRQQGNGAVFALVEEHRGAGPAQSGDLIGGDIVDDLAARAAVGCTVVVGADGAPGEDVLGAEAVVDDLLELSQAR